MNQRKEIGDLVKLDKEYKIISNPVDTICVRCVLYKIPYKCSIKKYNFYCPDILPKNTILKYSIKSVLKKL